MTPKEKAKELVHKFYDATEDHWNQDYVSKKCALIAVDLRLEGDFIFSSIEYGGEESLEYWNEVKQQIEKL